MKQLHKLTILLGCIALLMGGRSFAKKSGLNDSCEGVKSHYQQETNKYREQMRNNWDRFVDEYGPFNQFFTSDQQWNNSTTQVDDDKHDDDGRKNNKNRGKKGEKYEEKSKGRRRGLPNPTVRDPMSDTHGSNVQLESKFQELRLKLDSDLLGEYDEWVRAFLVTQKNNSQLQTSIDDAQESYRDDCYSPNKKAQHNLMKGRFKKAFTKVPLHTQEKLLPILMKKVLKLIENTENSNMTADVKQVRLDLLYALLDLLQDERANTGSGGSGNSNTGNASPVISSIANQVTTEESGVVVNYTISDSDGVLSCASNITVSSSNTSLLPLANITKSGTAPNCMLTLNPVVNMVGTSIIAIVVTDNSGANDMEDFLITVQAQNDNPVISNILDVNMAKNTSTGISVNITDSDSTLSCVSSLSVAASNTGLVENSSLVTTGIVPNCNLSITPNINTTGTANITVTVMDGSGGIASDVFALTVTD